ncbi:hypothetical protein MCOR23_000537 [Pyricularia oryzae]|nr:hypothetical protein MCOR23_000537 [Pyricularia oryzae]
MAVAQVHSSGYAHGDLHLGNILLKLPESLDRMPINKLYEQYGEPNREPVVRLDDPTAPKDPGIPSYVVPPVWLGVSSDDVTPEIAKLLLTDFGVAFRPDEASRFKSNAPITIRPPEAFFEPTKPLTFGSDIWSLGCVIFELFAHRTLIDGYFLPTQDYITAQQVQLQGPMPPEWWRAWDERPEWYDEAGRSLSPESSLWPWERRFDQWVQDPRLREGMELVSKNEMEALLVLLKWMLAWKPSQRPDITQVLAADWMAMWALPAYQSRGGRDDH